MVDTIRCLVSPTSRSRESKCFVGSRAFRCAETPNLASRAEPDHYLDSSVA